jgi:hypothetical protein
MWLLYHSQKYLKTRHTRNENIEFYEIAEKIAGWSRGAVLF